MLMATVRWNPRNEYVATPSLNVSGPDASSPPLACMPPAMAATPPMNSRLVFIPFPLSRIISRSARLAPPAQRVTPHVTEALRNQWTAQAVLHTEARTMDDPGKRAAGQMGEYGTMQ